MMARHLPFFKEYLYASVFILLLIILLPTYSSAQDVIYIDPSYNGATQNGSIDNPYKSWNSVSWVNGKTYLQKSGTTFTTSGFLDLTGRNGITLGSYGQGNRPRIITSAGNSVKVIKITGASNNTIRGLEIASSGGQATCAIIIDGTNSANNLIEDCVLRDVQWGLRVLTTGTGNRIIHSEVYNTQDDGIYIKDAPDIEIGHCNVYNVNLKYNVSTDQSYSPGDNIQIASTNNHHFYVHHNTLDHSSTGNKFCFIAWGNNYTGIFEYNILIGNRTKNTSCIYLSPTTGSVTVRYNSITEGNYGIYSYVQDLKIYYNTFVQNRIAVSILNNYNMLAENNVFYNSTSMAINGLPGSSLISKNNIFHIISGTKAYSTSGSLISNNNIFNIQSSGFLNGHNTLTSWRNASGQDQNSMVANPKFVNPGNYDFTLQSDSPGINAGSSCGYDQDFFGNSVPQGPSPDIGYFEFPANNVNNPPLISDQTFSIPENSPANTVVGTVIAIDPDQNQTIQYEITGGNVNNTFSINSATGAIKVQNAQSIDFEAYPQFTLQVKVTDQGGLFSTAQITITIQDVNENPEIDDQGFLLPENSPVNTTIGTVVASDPDQNQTLTYSIISGNLNNSFSINSTTGVIKVQNAQSIDFEANPQFTLQVKVTDQGGLVSTAQITINIQDVNENPETDDQGFILPENSPVNTTIGTVAASDPDQNQTLTYSIISGNLNNSFSINSTTGVIKVQNAQSIDFETNPQFTLQVKVTDQGGLFSTAQITINIQDVNENPELEDYEFEVTSASNNGTVIGQLTASDPDAGQSLNYVITNGNFENCFSLNSINGSLSVVNSVALNNYSQFILTVKVSDDGQPSLYSYGQVIINVSSSNSAPVILPQAFQITENSFAGSHIGQILAYDANQGQNLTFQIISGNAAGTFNCSPSGFLTVNNAGLLDHELYSSFQLLIRVTDNGSPILSADAVIDILVTDVNESPIITPGQFFNVNGNSGQGLVIGQVLAADPDNNQQLNFEIIAGNVFETFGIVASTGELYVANASYLKRISGRLLRLTIKVTDSGYPSLSSSEVVKIKFFLSNSNNNQNIARADSQYGFSIYPNPSHDGKFILDLGDFSKASATYRITDLNGAEKYFGSSPDNKNTIDLSHLPKGMYILQVKRGDLTEIKKLIYQ